MHRPIGTLDESLTAEERAHYNKMIEILDVVRPTERMNQIVSARKASSETMVVKLLDDLSSSAKAVSQGVDEVVHIFNLTFSGFFREPCAFFLLFDFFKTC